MQRTESYYWVKDGPKELIAYWNAELLRWYANGHSYEEGYFSEVGEIVPSNDELKKLKSCKDKKDIIG